MIYLAMPVLRIRCGQPSVLSLQGTGGAANRKGGSHASCAYPRRFRDFDGGSYVGDRRSSGHLIKFLDDDDAITTGTASVGSSSPTTTTAYCANGSGVCAA